MKFKCLESCGGKCCKMSWKGENSFVFLTSKDMTRLSALLGVPIKYFASFGEFLSTRFLKERSTQWFLKQKDGQCMFFKNGQCSIYEARPTQCKTFPFWPELLKKENYAQLKSECPGVGIGNVPDEIANSFLNEQIEADKELCSRNKLMK